MDATIFINYDRLLSYQCLLNFVIGSRGCGKSFGAKEYIINHFNKKHKKFVWLRRYGSQLDEAIGTPKEGCTLFKDLNQKKKYSNYEYGITENKKVKHIWLNGKLCGYGMSLKSAEDLKGTDYSDVDTIIFDEFLVGDGGSRYLKNEVMYLLSIIESIARFRNIRVICLGNSTSIVNPYFDFLNLSLPYNSEFKTFKDNTILVWYINNQKYQEAKKNSNFGKMVSGTAYESYAINNNFVNDNDNFIKKRTKSSRLLFNITINSKIYGVWIDKREMFISSKFNTNYHVNITFDYQLHNDKTLLVKGKSQFMQNITKHFKLGLLYFENQTIKYDMMDLLRKSNNLY